jgi:hypothetical protein
VNQEEYIENIIESGYFDELNYPISTASLSKEITLIRENEEAQTILLTGSRI